MNQPKFYGLIGGPYSLTYTEKINQHLDDAQVIKTWRTIEDLQKEINRNGVTTIKGISAILIIDKSFKENSSIESQLGIFNFLQSMFKDKELYGTHLVLYTKQDALYDMLNEQYESDPTLKYEGTRILKCDVDYNITSLAKVFEQPFSLLSYDEKTEREQEKQKKRLEQQQDEIKAKRQFMSLVGKKELLEDLIGTLNRELTVLNNQIYNYAMDLQSGNLESLTDMDTTIEIEISDQLKRLR